MRRREGAQVADQLLRPLVLEEERPPWMCSRRRDHFSTHGTPIHYRSPSPCTDRGVAGRGERGRALPPPSVQELLLLHLRTAFHAERLRRLEEDEGVTPVAGRGGRELGDDGGYPKIRRLCSTGGEWNSIPSHKSRGSPHRHGTPAGGGEGAAPLLRLGPALLGLPEQGKSPTAAARRWEEGRPRRRHRNHRRDLCASHLHFFASRLKDRLGDQRGGSEWEPIKILLEGD
jgi:hypothetical protein